jgi:hypothetical protein
LDKLVDCNLSCAVRRFSEGDDIVIFFVEELLMNSVRRGVVALELLLNSVRRGVVALELLLNS